MVKVVVFDYFAVAYRLGGNNGGQNLVNVVDDAKFDVKIGTGSFWGASVEPISNLKIRLREKALDINENRVGGLSADLQLSDGLHQPRTLIIVDFKAFFLLAINPINLVGKGERIPEQLDFQRFELSLASVDEFAVVVVSFNQGEHELENDYKKKRKDQKTKKRGTKHLNIKIY